MGRASFHCKGKTLIISFFVREMSCFDSEL